MPRLSQFWGWLWLERILSLALAARTRDFNRIGALRAGSASDPKHYYSAANPHRSLALAARTRDFNRIGALRAGSASDPTSSPIRATLDASHSGGYDRVHRTASRQVAYGTQEALDCEESL